MPSSSSSLVVLGEEGIAKTKKKYYHRMSPKNDVGQEQNANLLDEASITTAVVAKRDGV